MGGRPLDEDGGDWVGGVGAAVVVAKWTQLTGCSSSGHGRLNGHARPTR